VSIAKRFLPSRLSIIADLGRAQSNTSKHPEWAKQSQSTFDRSGRGLPLTGRDYLEPGGLTLRDFLSFLPIGADDPLCRRDTAAISLFPQGSPRHIRLPSPLAGRVSVRA
jgi:hypothetical protein